MQFWIPAFAGMTALRIPHSPEWRRYGSGVRRNDGATDPAFAGM